LFSQFQYQLDSLIKLNEELRTDLQRCELKNESYKSESLRLKAENKQFYGEQTILSKDFEEQYQPQTNLEESNRQLANIRADMVKLVVANQALNRQHQLSLETIKHLQKANLQYQRADSGTDQMVLLQSLESELERERKVRVEAEGDLREHKNQVNFLFIFVYFCLYEMIDSKTNQIFCFALCRVDKASERKKPDIN